MSAEYSPEVQKHLALAYTPKCALCHVDADGGAASTPFARSMTARGMRGGGDLASVDAALDAMKRDNVDSDGDGQTDVDVLAYGGDPNVPSKPEASGVAPGYGCAVGGAGGGGTDAIAIGIAMALAVISRSRRHRRTSSLAIAVCVALAGCAASTHHAADAVDVPASSASAAPKPPPRVDVDVAHALVFEPRNVTVVIATAPIAAHPIGKRLGPLVAAMPQWKGAVEGMVGDPLHDLEWIYATGASLRRGARTALLARVAFSDDEVEARVAKLLERSPSAAPFDLGVAGAKGTLANVGGGDARVVVRAQPRVVAIVPEDAARASAATLARSRVVPPLEGREALRAIVKRPHDHLVQAPAAISEARVVVVAKEDGGADLRIVGDCADAAAAAATADEVRSLVQRSNGMIVRMVTKNILGGAEVNAVDSRVEVHLEPTAEQVEATLRIVATLLGVDIDGATP